MLAKLAEFKAASAERRLAERPAAEEALRKGTAIIRGAEELKIFHLVRGAAGKHAPRCS